MEEYVAFIEELERLKNVTRTSWSSCGRRESTAEHSWRLAVFAGLALEKLPELDGKRVLMMALLHDIGELYGGDISAAERPDAGKKYREEAAAVKRAVSLLSEPLREKITELWEEYEIGESEEARLVKALDKAETIIQHNQGKNPPDFDYDFNLEYGKEWFVGPEAMQSLRRRLDRDTRARMEDQEKGAGK